MYAVNQISAEARRTLISLLMQEFAIPQDHINEIADQLDGYSGADIATLCR